MCLRTWGALVALTWGNVPAWGLLVAQVGVYGGGMERFETCPRCGGEGVEVRNGVETTCHGCYGEGWVRG